MADNSFYRYAEIIGKSSSEQKLILQFAKQASAENANGALLLLTSSIHGREDFIKQDFNDRVFPIFKNYIMKKHSAHQYFQMVAKAQHIICTLSQAMVIKNRSPFPLEKKMENPLSLI